MAVFGMTAKETANAAEKTTHSITTLALAGVAVYFVGKKLKVF